MKKFKYLLLALPLTAFIACGGDDDTPADTPEPVVIKVDMSVGIVTTTATTADIKATFNGSGITSRGICYATTPSPTTANENVTLSGNSASYTISGLTPATTYYIRAYAVVNNQTMYSTAISFTTKEQTADDQLAAWTAPTYADDYRNFAGWDQRARWNLANVHDPSVMLAEDGYFYMYQTDAGFGNPTDGHGHFHCRRSRNLVDWEYLGGTMPELPAWIPTKLNEIRAAMGLGTSTTDYNKCGYWAPCVRKVRNGLYRMYYVITIDGFIDGPNTWGERAFIGLMETATPANVNSWVDKGFVITNYSDKNLNFRVKPDDWQNCYYRFNAIDPSYFIDPNDGRHWLAYGSWHSGFALVEINPETGKTVVDPLPNPWGAANAAAYGKRIATRAASNRWQGSEAPELIYHDGYYYLFMAYDGLDVPYNTRVVRSKNVEGPYVGINGANVTNGADAYPIMTHPYKFSGNQGWVGISHCAVFDDGNGNWYYASQQRFPADMDTWAPNAVMMGGVRSILWTSSGWPVVMPERYAAVPQVPISDADIVGAWEHIDLSYKYGEMKESGTMVFGEDHKISSGPWKGGAWSFDPSTNTLTANGVELKVQRECDWESSPRHHTIVYAGLNGQKTYWGKKR